MKRRFTTQQELDGVYEFKERCLTAMAGSSFELKKRGYREKAESLIICFPIISTVFEEVIKEAEEEVDNATTEYERQHRMAGHL